MHYAEVEILNSGNGMMIGVGRPEVARTGSRAYRESGAGRWESFWGVTNRGGLSHEYITTDWRERQQGFGQGDTIGLLLDCGAGCLVAYKNDARLGVVATGLTGELCWAVAMGYEGDSVRITGKPPPALQ